MLPLVYQPSEASRRHGRGHLLKYVQAHREQLIGDLYQFGALLFRDFAVDDAGDFQEIVRCFAPKLRNYEGGDSPRTAVTDKVYTSTSYPPSLSIPLHNEMSYTRDYPALVAFYCEIPPRAGGETPLADCRRVLRSLSLDAVDRVKRKKIRYLQNLGDGPGIGKSWRETFETEERGRVEEILKARGATFRWKADGSLHIAEVVDPVVTHPQTGESVFFSQAHMWHVSNLDAKTRRALLKIMGEEDLYHHCTFGDGSRLDDNDLDEMRRALDDATVTFAWQKHDVLLVDNLLIAHGRRPFQGQRRVLVAMG